MRKTAKKYRLLRFVFALAPAFAIALLFPVHGGNAHHTSAISYVFQKVGEQKAGCYAVEMIATPPRLAVRKKISKAEMHRRLERFTHRFQVVVRREPDAKPVPGLRVRAKFTGEEWEKTFALRPRTEKGVPVYAANVVLGPRGPYRVRVSVERAPACGGARRGERLTVRFDFDNDYESLKEVMRALLDALDQLGRTALTAGLDGELVPPQKEARIRKLAKRFQGLVPWTVNLRDGASQEVYEAHAARLLEISEKIQSSSEKGNLDALVRRLAAARSVCVGCHEIFQEADATGAHPHHPGEGGGKKESSSRR